MHSSANKSKHQPMIKEGSEKEALLANFNYFNNPSGVPVGSQSQSGTEYIPHYGNTQMYYQPIHSHYGARYSTPEMHTTQIVNPYMVGKYPYASPYQHGTPGFYHAMPPRLAEQEYAMGLRHRATNPYAVAPHAYTPAAHQPAGPEHHNKENINRLYHPEAKTPVHPGSTPDLKNMSLHQAAAAAAAWQKQNSGASYANPADVGMDGRIKLGHVSNNQAYGGHAAGAHTGQGAFQSHSVPNLVGRGGHYGGAHPTAHMTAYGRPAAMNPHGVHHAHAFHAASQHTHGMAPQKLNHVSSSEPNQFAAWKQKQSPAAPDVSSKKEGATQGDWNDPTSWHDKSYAGVGANVHIQATAGLHGPGGPAGAMGAPGGYAGGPGAHVKPTAEHHPAPMGMKPRYYAPPGADDGSHYAHGQAAYGQNMHYGQHYQKPNYDLGYGQADPGQWKK